MWYFPLIPIFSLLDASEIVDYILFLSCLFASAASCSLPFLSFFLFFSLAFFYLIYLLMIVQFKLIHLLSDGCERCALVCAGVCECVQ